MSSDPSQPNAENAVPSNTRYIQPEAIGRGGSGSVTRVWDTQLGRYVAIKRLRPDAEFQAELQKEAAILATLQHPNIVTIFDVNADEEGIYVVMELVNGYTMDEVVEGRPMEMEAFVDLADQICRGLSAAHAHGLVHQDLKPANIMLHYHEDQSLTVKILDFGLAKSTADEAVAADDDAPLLGSVHTIAPEQLQRKPVDARTDIYSLGCVFYYALMGHFPYNKGTVQDIVNAHINSKPLPPHLYRVQVPEPVSNLVVKMMAHDPNDRPQTVDEIRKTLQMLQSTGKITRPLPPPTPSNTTTTATNKQTARTAPTKKSPKSKLPILIGTSIATIIIAILIATYVNHLRKKNAPSATAAVASATRASTPPPASETWQSKNIGSVKQAGNSAYNASGQQFSVSGSGKGPDGKADSLFFNYRQISGDCTITAFIVSQRNTTPQSEAGVMIRQSLAPDSQQAITMLMASSHVRFLFRTNKGEAVGDSYTVLPQQVSSPAWVRLKRHGNDITSFYSTDGEKWEKIGQTRTIPMTDPVYVGMAVSSGDNATMAQAIFTQVSISVQTSSVIK